jgi:hypothetical protein
VDDAQRVDELEAGHDILDLEQWMVNTGPEKKDTSD